MVKSCCEMIIRLIAALLIMAAIGCNQLDSEDAEAVDRMLRFEEERSAIEGPHIRLQSHPFCRWVFDGMPGHAESYGEIMSEEEIYEKYGHGVVWWTENYDSAKSLAVTLGAANPEVVVSEWCERRDTPRLAYTPKPE